MDTLLISFYSDIEDNTYYSDHARRLISECEDLEIPHDIRKKESLGSYQLNCLSKPQYILNMLEGLNPLLTLSHSKPRPCLNRFHQQRIEGACRPESDEL